MRKDPGGLESEWPWVPIYISALKIVPVTHCSEFVNYSPKSGKRSLKLALSNYGSIGDKVVDNILKILKEEGFIIPLNEK